MADLYDVAAFRLVTGQDAVHVMADALSRGELLKDEAKLAQRVVFELLTEKRSMPYARDRGTGFVTRLRSGRVRTEHDLFVAYAAASLDLGKNLRAEESASDPPRERYGKAKLLSMKLGSQGDAILSIQITSRAGTSVGLILPVNVKL